MLLLFMVQNTCPWKEPRDFWCRTWCQVTSGKKKVAASATCIFFHNSSRGSVHHLYIISTLISVEIFVGTFAPFLYITLAHAVDMISNVTLLCYAVQFEALALMFFGVDFLRAHVWLFADGYHSFWCNLKKIVLVWKIVLVLFQQPDLVRTDLTSVSLCRCIPAVELA